MSPHGRAQIRPSLWRRWERRTHELWFNCVRTTFLFRGVDFDGRLTIPRPSPASGVSCSVLAPVLRALAFDLATRLCLWTAERVAGEAAAISGGAVLRGVGVQRSWTGVGGAFPGGTGHISIPPPVPAGGFKPSAPPLTESSSSSSQIDMWKQRDPGGQGPSARTLRGCGCLRSCVPGSKAGHPAGPQAPGEPAGGSRLPRRAPGGGGDVRAARSQVRGGGGATLTPATQGHSGASSRRKPHRLLPRREHAVKDR